MLMLLSVSQKMNEKVGAARRLLAATQHLLVLPKCLRVCVSQDRERVMPLMIRGFRDAAEEGGTSVTGGQTVVNPWIIIGGVASVVCQPNEFIM